MSPRAAVKPAGVQQPLEGSGRLSAVLAVAAAVAAAVEGCASSPVPVLWL